MRNNYPIILIKKQTVKKAEFAISRIDRMLLAWQRKKKKSKKLIQKVKLLKKFHRNLLKWKKSEKIHNIKRENNTNGIKLLSDYIMICKNYKEGLNG